MIIYSYLVTTTELDLRAHKFAGSYPDKRQTLNDMDATIRVCGSLARASATLQVEVLDYVRKHCGIATAQSWDVLKMPDYLHLGGCLLIQKLELNMNGSMLLFPKRHWPDQLDVFVRHMPHLSWFKLEAFWGIQDGYAFESKKDEEGMMTGSQGFQRGRLLRFLSLLLLRHANLDLLIWPAKCQARRQSNDFGTITEWFIVEKKWPHGRKWELAAQPKVWMKPQDLNIQCDVPDEAVCFEYVEDQILSSRPIRRLLEHELAQTGLHELVVHPADHMTKDDIESSETPETNVPLMAIDREAFCDRSSRELDELIRRCQPRQKVNFSRSSRRARTNSRAGRRVG